MCWCRDHRALFARVTGRNLPTVHAHAMSQAPLLSRLECTRASTSASKPALRIGAWTLLDHGEWNSPEPADMNEMNTLPQDLYAARRFWSASTPLRRTIYFLSWTATGSHTGAYSLRALDDPSLWLMGASAHAVWHQLIERVRIIWQTSVPPVANNPSLRSLWDLCSKHESILAQRFFCPVPMLVRRLACADAQDPGDAGKRSCLQRDAARVRLSDVTGSARCRPYERPSNAEKWACLGTVHGFVGSFLHQQHPLNVRPGRPSGAESRIIELSTNAESTQPRCKRSATGAVPATAAERREYRQMQIKARQYCVPLRSRIHGFGLFARCDLEPDQMIIEYAGERIASPVADVRERHYDRRGIGCYMFRIDADWVIDATMRGSVARFINHSCRPNCYSEILRLSDQPGHDVIVIRSSRAIRRGEELTYNYMFDLENASKIPCFCGDRDCVGFMN
ncbi:hypothetical protein F1559_000088 [Cyanidiococcus yangmingshanensis]|uniref:[histone H3]-lysine(4) N-trimethyltransferase n=1 Tax=Cyanidiococcus yangmingshanensis TaxID=2690220 RepID=A0A7J7IE00_9RHOD|nr:hypothetical protein F1559_000088 [Cyanidiococcus yangmingshanensis]